MTDAMADQTALRVRRALVLTGLLALPLVLSACGGSSKPKPLEHPATVKVYFCTTVSMTDCTSDATAAQEQAVGQELRRMPNVTKVAFVSKSVGLEQFKKENPGLMRALPTVVNPLPDEWLVTVASDRDRAKVGKQVCGARYPGVAPCPKPGDSRYGDIGGAVWKSIITSRIRAWCRRHALQCPGRLRR
jgi:hypothetical protein